MESKSKIVNPERISRIIRKMCNARMNVVLKFDESIVGIRGTFYLIETAEKKQLIRLGGISARGVELLSNKKIVKVEVLGMPSRVVFKSSLLSTTDDQAVISIPKRIVAIERRQNVRHATTPELMGYLKLTGWRPQINDVAAPPVIPAFEELAAMIPIVDLSLGGACIISSFFGTSKEVEARQNPMQGELVFPMLNPIEVEFFLRWKKKTVNRFRDEAGIERARLEFRFGIEFEEMADTTVLRIRQFMRQLSMAQAI